VFLGHCLVNLEFFLFGQVSRAKIQSIAHGQPQFPRGFIPETGKAYDYSLWNYRKSIGNRHFKSSINADRWL